MDESGLFANPDKESHAPLCVAALVIPTACHQEVLDRFQSLKTLWGASDAEIKGSKPDETDFHAALTLLAEREFDSLAFFEVMDFGLQKSESVANHKRLQADTLIKNLTEEHQPTLIAQLHEMRSTMLSLPEPLYVQLILLTHLVRKVFQTGSLFHAFRTPEELGTFEWIIDAKDKSRTEYEELWRLCLLPWIQSRPMKEPFDCRFWMTALPTRVAKRRGSAIRLLRST